jgi:hypothetical protein
MTTNSELHVCFLINFRLIRSRFRLTKDYYFLNSAKRENKLSLVGSKKVTYLFRLTYIISISLRN